MIVKPFRGLRPRRDLAACIPSYPYDVLDSEEARKLAQGDPYTFLHVVKSEIDLDPSVEPYDERVYAKARENFLAMVERGWLVQDGAEAYYVYRLVMSGHVQTGILGAAAVDDYLEGRIKRHEHTRPDKEDDRTRHTAALAAHPGPVFLAYRGVDQINALVSGILDTESAVDFIAPDGVRHTLWVVADPRTRRSIAALFAEVPATYIADGHHRAASYARVAMERRARNRTSSGADADNFFLAIHFPAEQLRILDYNRLVRDLNRLEIASFLERVRAAGFVVSEGHDERRPPRRGTFGMYVGGRWFLLAARPDLIPRSDPVGGLDVAVLSERLLKPVLGIEDPRTDTRIAFVPGGRGPGELERRVASGEHAVAFALFPTSLDDVMLVADAGKVMPPKSTWFEPKPRSGMVVHLIPEES